MTITNKEKDMASVDFLPPHTYAHCVQDYQIQTLCSFAPVVAFYIVSM